MNQIIHKVVIKLAYKDFILIKLPNYVNNVKILIVLKKIVYLVCSVQKIQIAVYQIFI